MKIISTIQRSWKVSNQEAVVWRNWIREPAQNTLPPTKELKRRVGGTFSVAPNLQLIPSRSKDTVTLSEEIRVTPFYDPEMGILGTRVFNQDQDEPALTAVLRLEAAVVAPFYTAATNEPMLLRDMFFLGLIPTPPPPMETSDLSLTLEVKYMGTPFPLTDKQHQYAGATQEMMHIRALFPWTRKYPSPFAQTGENWTTNPLRICYPTLPLIDDLRQKKIIKLRYEIQTVADTHFLNVYGIGPNGKAMLLTVLEPLKTSNQLLRFKRTTLGKWIIGTSSRPQFYTPVAAVFHETGNNYSVRFGYENCAYLLESAPYHPYKGRRVVMAGPGQNNKSYQVFGENPDTQAMDLLIQTVVISGKGKEVTVTRSTQHPPSLPARKTQNIVPHGRDGGLLKPETYIWLKWVRAKNPDKVPCPPIKRVKVNTNGMVSVAPRVTVDISELFNNRHLPQVVESRPYYDPSRKTAGVLLALPGKEKPFLKVVLRRRKVNLAKLLKPYALRPEHEWAFDLGLYCAGLLKKLCKPCWSTTTAPARNIELEYFVDALPLAEPQQVYLSAKHLAGVPILCAKIYTPKILSFATPLYPTQYLWRMRPENIITREAISILSLTRRHPHEILFKLALEQGAPVLKMLIRERSPWQSLVGLWEPSAIEGHFPAFTQITIANWLAGKCQKPNFFSMARATFDKAAGSWNVKIGDLRVELPPNAPFFKFKKRRMVAIKPSANRLGIDVFGVNNETKRMDLLIEPIVRETIQPDTKE